MVRGNKISTSVILSPNEKHHPAAAQPSSDWQLSPPGIAIPLFGLLPPMDSKGEQLENGPKIAGPFNYCSTHCKKGSPSNHSNDESHSY
jgi:hypothetical protein